MARSGKQSPTDYQKLVGGALTVRKAEVADKYPIGRFNGKGGTLVVLGYRENLKYGNWIAGPDGPSKPGGGYEFPGGKDTSDWYTGPIVGTFRFADIVIGGDELPSVILENVTEGYHAMMTLDAYRRMMIRDDIGNFPHGIIRGVFNVVKYPENDSSHYYLELI